MPVTIFPLCPPSDNPEGKPETKACQYPTCQRTIPLNSTMQYCDPCRILANRNATVILMDPFSPPTERSSSIIHTMYHNLTTEEKINQVAKAEAFYIEFSKLVLAEKLELKSTKRTWANLENELEDARSADHAPRTHKAKATKEMKVIAKRKKTLGPLGDSQEAKDWLKENVEF